MDAITLLRDDHSNVKQLFQKFEGLGDGASKAKQDVVDEIIEELSVHAAIEEEHFYPTVQSKVDEAEDVVREGVEEHLVVKRLLLELMEMTPEDEQFDAKVSVLIENVRHHIEEEEDDMFPKVRDAMGRSDLQALGETMEAAKATAPTRPDPSED